MATFVAVRLKGAREILRGLDRMERAIEVGSSQAIGHRLGTEGLRIVKQLTPRQRNTQREGSTKRGHPPLYRQWELIESVISRSNYRGVIRNRARLTPAGLAALASVEFGARPHEIRPRGGGRARLVWFQPGRSTAFDFRSSPSSRQADATGSVDSLDVIDRLSARRRREGFVVARRVQHPGHRSFRMVSETRDHLNRLTRTVLREFDTQLRRAFSGLSVDVR